LTPPRELREKCRVYGDVSAPIVIIAEGALFGGQRTLQKSRRETAFSLRMVRSS